MTSARVTRIVGALVFGALGAMSEWAVMRQYARHVFGVWTLIFLQIFVVYFLSVTVRLLKRAI